MLVVYGGRDEIVSPDLAAAVADHAISSAYVKSTLIHGAGHGLGFYDEVASHGEETVDVTFSFFARNL